MAEDEKRSSRTAKKCAQVSSIIVKQEIRARMKQVNVILKKPVDERTSEELIILDQSPDIADAVQKRCKHRQLAKDRVHEVEDPDDILMEKCGKLADAIRDSNNLVIYTGAGISTAASIPDYRGPNGVWTLLQKGVAIKAQDLSDAEPTFTHMSITRLYEEGKVKHVVSQNCDGLHLRSGFPRHKLSEVHGDMFIEICRKCKPQKEYIRLFDVTERTGMRRHRTGRTCHTCGEDLKDTIIHFGEKAPFTSPYNWEEAAEAVDNADLVLCLGSSLKVLKKYGCLWNLHKPLAKRPKLFIANLQWTPKDDSATVKLNGKCDRIMEIVMSKLGYQVPAYNRLEDTIFKLATDLLPHELNSTSKKILQRNKCLEPSTAMKVIQDESLVMGETMSKGTETCSTPEIILTSVPNQTKQEVTGFTDGSNAEQNVKANVQELSENKHNLDMIKALLRSQIMDKVSLPISTQYSQAQTSTSGSGMCQIKNEFASSYSVGSPISGKCISSSTITSSSGYSALLQDSPISHPIEYVCQNHTLCSSEVMNSLTDQSQLDSDMATNKPSDKYKLIKYLLNKPADVSDEKLKQFTEKLRDICGSASLGELASEYQSRLIYSTAGSLNKHRATTQSESQGFGQNPTPAQLSKSYPTLIGALRGMVQADSKGSAAVAQQNNRSGIHPNPATQKILGFPPSSTSSVQSLGPLSIDVGGASGSAAARIPPPQAAGLLLTAGAHSDVGFVTGVQGSATLFSDDQTSLVAAHQMKRSASAVEAVNNNDVTDAEQAENISPAHSGSAPGWFGKGLNIKKRKKKSR